MREAAHDALRQLHGLAGAMLGLTDTGADAFDTREGQIVLRSDPSRHIGFREVAARMGDYMIVGHGARGPNPDGKALNTFGAHFCQVLVNTLTGQMRVEKIVAVHENGRIVNPLVAASQVYGGVIMALGYGLSEERVLDPRTGLQLTANLEDYQVPTMADVPAIEVVFVDQSDPEANSVGCKGLGEPPIIPLAAALANAVSDALGVRLTQLPLSPDRVLGALHPRKEVAP